MKTPELPPADYIQADLFPAKVSGPSIDGGAMDRIRFVVTDRHLLILKLTKNGDIELAHEAELGTLSRAPEVGPRGFRVVTAEGDVVEAQKSLNCGCGMSRIKGVRYYDPMPPMRALPYP